MSTYDTRHLPTGRHPVNITHLVMGLAFLGIVSIWVAIESGTVAGDDIRWLLPLPWILAGVAGLTAAFLTGRRRNGADRQPLDDLRVDDLDITKEI